MDTYLIKANLALALFYLIYKVLIYNKSNHQFKRIVGLCIVLFCTFFVFIPPIDWVSSPEVSERSNVLLDTSQAINSSLEFTIPEEQLSTLSIVYLTGIGLFSIRFLAGILGLLRLYIRSGKSTKWGFRLVKTPNPISPFSFFNLLFIHSVEDNENELKPIVMHEQVHRDQLHSLDVLLLEILAVIYWWNPFIWLLRKDIKASHEFIADEYVVGKGIDKLAYQDLLFKERTGISYKAVSYLSNQTSLKQRFNIMEKRKINLPSSYTRAGIVLVAMALTAFIYACSGNSDVLITSEPEVKIFTEQGLVDTDNGISSSTSELFVRIIPSDEQLAYRVSVAETTLVSGGLGRGQIKSGERISLGSILTSIPEGADALLLIEVKEYQTKDRNDVIQTIKPDEPMMFRIPVK